MKFPYQQVLISYVDMTSDNKWADVTDKLTPAIIAPHRMFVIDVAEIDGKKYHFLGTEPMVGDNGEWQIGYRVTILSEAIISIKTITNRKKSLPTENQGKNGNVPLENQGKRGCKRAAESSNKGIGCVVRDANAGANPTSAAIPTPAPVTDHIIGREQLK